MPALKREPALRQSAEVIPLRGLCPTTDEITPYDTRNLPLYVCLLIHAEDGTTIEELASEILGFDLSHDRDWALRVTLSHLRRARFVNDRLFPWID
jgi:hypothetical protein